MYSTWSSYRYGLGQAPLPRISWAPDPLKPRPVAGVHRRHWKGSWSANPAERAQPIAGGVHQHDAVIEARIAANKPGWPSSMNSDPGLEDAPLSLIGAAGGNMGLCDEVAQGAPTGLTVPSEQGGDGESECKTHADSPVSTLSQNRG